MAKTPQPNPYEPSPSPAAETTKTSRPRWALVASIVTGLFAIPIIGPGFAAFLMGFGFRGQSGRRYATYDHEIIILGVPVTPIVAYLVALMIGPLVMLLSFYCLRVYWRGSWRKERR